MDKLEYIPLDFIKVKLIGVVKGSLENNSLLSFIPRLGELGEIRYYYAKYRNMIIRIYNSGYITMAGSLHRFFNDGEHNYNNFGKRAFRAVLRRFKLDLGVLPNQMRIVTLEYGVNVLSPISVMLCLHHIMFHQKEEVGIVKTNKKGKYIEVIHSCYRIKIYSKGKQHDLGIDLLRVEIKQTNWSVYRLAGIETMQDFIDVDKQGFLFNLVKRWNEMLFYDPTIKIPGRWIKYSNPNFWRNVFCKSRTALKKHVDRLNKLNQSSEKNVQETIAKLIESKVYELQKG